MLTSKRRVIVNWKWEGTVNRAWPASISEMFNKDTLTLLRQGISVSLN